ncbi:MAG: biopolymer transporter ExbD [Bacteroidales bacterium]|nr:biopolymer transporter ExbD [Bacteroidales bacterium]MBQ6081196.1 biopolymer transporter ExbD [Bacteroidales bacterium]
MASKKTPEINGSSMADIAFIALIFFLMVTTMDQEKGLPRRLPPMPDENMKLENEKVNRRNIVIVKINVNDRVFAGDEPIDVSQLKDKIVTFLTNPADDPNLPEKVVKDIEGFGPYAVSKGVISLQNDRGTTYSQYIAVQNELVKAINEIRDDFSVAHYGKTYAQLDDDKQKIVRKCIPQQISEAEPKDTKLQK